MQATFLDTATFSIDLPKPASVNKMLSYDTTPQDADTIVGRCIDSQIIITNKVVLDKPILQRLPNLKLIHITATGMNNVDLQACRELGISVKNVAGYSSVSVPEHTFMFILGAMRAGLDYHRRASDGEWQADGKFCLVDTPIVDLAGKTLGIIGAGTLGKKVGQIATAFGMTVLYAERQGEQVRDGRTDFDSTLAQSDIISLHCALTDDTHHLINTDTIAKMTKKPLIVNMARGGVVKTADIAKALQHDDIFGYCSDVFEDEPPLDDTLLKFKNHPRVFFTPHNAWASVGAQSRLWDILCTQIDDFVKNHS